METHQTEIDLTPQPPSLPGKGEQIVNQMKVERQGMTWLSALLAFFPTLVMLLVGGSFLAICISPSIWAISLLLFSLYGLPLLIYRIHSWFYPVLEGISYLQGKDYSPWWGSHQLQAIYVAFPALETILRVIPGAFSLWLRLWGSKVGAGVYWTPHLEIADRGLLEIGDRVIFGHQVGLYPHIIKPRKQDLMLYVKKIKIRDGVFLGAWNHLGPGVVVQAETYIPVFTHVYPNQTIDQSKVQTLLAKQQHQPSKLE
ncbi:acyl transferase [Trichocoleus sp. FACHB-591]|uniref:acyl transferase n=1 Tax=Trichocoleus sp. FACHB-591 TaxID=2692872 RepID=UPI001F54C380|nr:acyl transferase [Trichocoleus sp. FACHB-591]